MQDELKTRCNNFYKKHNNRKCLKMGCCKDLNRGSLIRWWWRQLIILAIDFEWK